MKLTEAKNILNNNGYLLKEDAVRNNTDMSDICAIIDAHSWSPKLVAQQLEDYYYNIYLKHADSENISTVDYINQDNYKKYIGKFVDVTENVDLGELGLTKLPIKFGKVGGSFNCNGNYLTTLDGAPKEVGGIFSCSDNELTSLNGAPVEVGDDFDCVNNELTTLEGAPKTVGGTFYCNKNNLTTLEGAPKKVGGSFFCYKNKVQFTKDDVLAVSYVKGRYIEV